MSKLLVTGASGGLGQLVLTDLLDRHHVAPDRIIAVTRSPERLTDFAARGVTVRAGDFDDPETLPAAFAGADRLLLISTDADPLQSYLDDVDPMGDPNRRRVRRQIGAVRAAEQAGVAHIVYTSAPNPEPPTGCFWKRDHYRTELAIRGSAMSWSILRNWEYPDFHLIYSWAHAIGSGEYLAGSGAGRCAFITREDCARAAAAALANSATESRVHNITGATAYTLDEVLSLVGNINNREIVVTHLRPAELRQRLAERGEELAPVLAAFHEGVGLGKYALVSDDFEQLTGDQPGSLEDFLRANRVAP